MVCYRVNFTVIAWGGEGVERGGRVQGTAKLSEQVDILNKESSASIKF